MGTTWKEKKCPGLKAFPLDDSMNEHSLGSALKKLFHRSAALIIDADRVKPSTRRWTLQALTA
ncbi:hypothetical protein LG307_15950 [Sutcliffiella horikoshii]|uniref:hypothetical protein n=1 Tax=Sutcliffiella horikoshii TaxID=79883 RepID=UPI00384DD7E8